MHFSTLLPTISLLILSASAKTDIGGCVSTEVPYMTRDTLVYRSLLWYVPDTGELCELLDCGGGRAPPKTNVPGCGNYKGTDTYSPQYWTGFKAAATTSTEPAAPVATTTSTTTAGPATISPSNSNTGGAVVSPTVTSSGTAGGVKQTTFATVTETTSAPGSGAEAQQSGSSTKTQSEKTSSVSTAGAAPTGVRMMGVVAGVAAAGWAIVA
ncbi:hypothetical protein QBC43DRAFT_31042 [Cladorrhinum sp. PSN259]|nr:hypothetical protein QBC43DRAFT_31042 [Cladorrhinum sp. PSN259]